MAENQETKSLFERLGGYPTLQKVHKIFYDKVYAHSWIGRYFADVKQEVIESQQTDFMAQVMGGPEKYLGKYPIPAHKHMMITEELFEVRTQLLIEAMNEAGVPKNLQEAWMKFDTAFKKGIVKSKIEDCQKRYNTDEIVNFPNPSKKVA